MEDNETQVVQEETPTSNETNKPAQVEELGDGGKKALAAERKARAEAERKLKAYEDQQKSQYDLLTERAEKAENAAKAAAQKYATVRKETLLTKAAVAAKAIDPDVIYALLSTQCELDEDGNLMGVDAAMANLQKNKPYLFDTGAKFQRDAGSKTTINAGMSPDDWLRGGI